MHYLDHNASSPVRPGVLALVAEIEREAFGNPSSLHSSGRRARALLEEGRETIARHLEVRPAEIVFTSGGTEANRLAIEGALEGCLGGSRRPGSPPPHAVVSGIEHPSVLGVYARLEARGVVTTTIVPAREDGRVPPAAVVEALRPETRIVSLQLVNNETGAVQDVAGVERVCRARRDAARGGGEPLLLHVDAVQALGKLPFVPRALGADLCSMSSHKLGGPKGAGALYVRAGSGYLPPVAGGPQERRMRPGTENLPAVAGFVRAVELASMARPASGHAEGAALRELLARIPGSAFNGESGVCLPGTVNVSFQEVPAELLVIRLDREGVAVSTGSACASGSREPSHVLRAMGLPEARIRSAVRFSTGWSTTLEEVEAAARIVADVVGELRAALGRVA